MSKTTLHLTPGHLTLEQLRLAYRQPVALRLDPACFFAVDASSAAVAEIIAYVWRLRGQAGFGAAHAGG